MIWCIETKHPTCCYVENAIKELNAINIVVVFKKNKRNYYEFTPKFLGYLKMIPQKIWEHTPKYLGNITQNTWGNNILKEKEKTRKKNFLNSNLEENRTSSNLEEVIGKSDLLTLLAKNFI